jgi:aspartate aminotransferase-like enzyme
MVNLTSPGTGIIVMVGGAFARRWSSIGKAFGLAVHEYDVDWRQGPGLDDVVQAMDRWPDAEVVFLTWSESSTGVTVDLEEIGRLIRARGRYLAVDAVSGLGVSPFEMDRWSVDAVVASSQKGLMMPAGLGVVAVNERALDRSRDSRSPRFTWDWIPYLERVPVTPPLGLMNQLAAALNLIERQGLDAVYQRRERVARAVRERVGDWGFGVFARNPGNGITAANTPPEMDVESFRRRLEQDFGIVVAEGQIPDTPGFRIGHVGHLTDDELAYFLESVPRALSAEGIKTNA